MTSRFHASRRSVLGAALATVGLAGTGAAARFGTSVQRDDESDSSRMAAGAPAMPTLYLDRYTTHTGDRARGAQRRKGDQTVMRGTLTTEAGDRVGEIFTSAMTMPGPVEPDTPDTPRMEIQNLQLNDGAIMGMGTVFAQSDIPNTYTVVGGSGRYAGARGGYTFDDNPSVASPQGRATITFSLVT